MAAEAFAEVVGTPYVVYVGAVDATVPKIDATPDAGTWKIFGVNGLDNQGSEGVTVNLAESVSSFKPAGKTLKVKDWRTEEDPMVAFSVVDTTVEALAQVLDDATITTVAAGTGTAAEKSINLVRGVQVAYFSLLVRGLSPYDDGSGLNCQYEFSRVCQSGSQSLKYVLGTPAEVACEFSVRGDVAGHDPAIYRAQTAPHT